MQWMTLSQAGLGFLKSDTKQTSAATVTLLTEIRANKDKTYHNLILSP